MTRPLLAPDSIAVVVAVSEEYRAICRRLTAIRMEVLDGLPVMRGDLGCMPASVLCSGMGGDRASRVTELALRFLEPSLVIGAGFAGGVGPSVGRTHVVVASRVVDAEGTREVRAARAEVDRLERAHDALDYMREHPEHADDAPVVALTRDMVHVGAVASASETVNTPLQKAALAVKMPDVLAIDMESLAIASAASQAGVPWAVIRSITDGPADTLPIGSAGCSDAQGQPDRLRIVMACVVRPWTIPALVRLGVASRYAAGNLAAYVEAYARAMGGELR